MKGSGQTRITISRVLCTACGSRNTFAWDWELEREPHLELGYFS